MDRARLIRIAAQNERVENMYAKRLRNPILTSEPAAEEDDTYVDDEPQTSRPAYDVVDYGVNYIEAATEKLSTLIKDRSKCEQLVSELREADKRYPMLFVIHFEGVKEGIKRTFTNSRLDLRQLLKYIEGFLNEIINKQHLTRQHIATPQEQEKTQETYSRIQQRLEERFQTPAAKKEQRPIEETVAREPQHEKAEPEEIQEERTAKRGEAKEAESENEAYTRIMRPIITKVQSALSRAHLQTLRNIAGVIDIEIAGTKPELLKRLNQALVDIYFGSKANRHNHIAVYHAVQAADLFRGNSKTVLEINEALLTPHQFVRQNMHVGKSGHGLLDGLGQFSIGQEGKYQIDKKALRNNSLIIRYSRNRHLTEIKPQFVSNNAKDIIEQMCSSGNFDLKIFHKLTPKEKHLIEVLNNRFHIGVETGGDDSFQRRFELVRGEIENGNNSDRLKNEMRQMLVHMKQTGAISGVQMHQYLSEIGV
jgi:hypothetical protein